MTCRAPNTAICGAGSTLSEYEIYFNYARIKFPESVVYRPLLWANGPMPGLYFWPESLESDGPKSNWKSAPKHKGKNNVPCVCKTNMPDLVDATLDRQILIDKLQGYDFVGYHSYARRRYFELVLGELFGISIVL